MTRAVDVYHELLGNDAVAADSAGLLESGQRERGLFFGEHPLSVSVRPQLIDRTDWDRAVAAAESVHSALDALEQALLTDADLRAELDLSPGEEELALVESGYPSSPSARLDSFFADDVRYVEYNAESPAGMAYGDVLAEVFETLPVMRELRARYALTPLPTRDRQLDCMLRALRESKCAGEPAIAIVDWAGLPTLHEFELFRDYFERRGVRCCICEPRSLEYDGRALRACDGTAVNLVYRRVLTSELLAREEDSRALQAAYRDGAVAVVNSFRAKLLHKKMSLALLSDDRYAKLYTSEQQDAIARHVPWTRKVREGSTTHFSQPIDDLPVYICTHRRNLVLKPNDEYGGKGVVLGWTVDDVEWEQAVTVALAQSYVVQEAVPVPRQSFPVTVGEQLSFLDLAVDMDPYLFYGRVEGLLTRLSSSALLNVTAGEGSVVPAYVVEGPR